MITLDTLVLVLMAFSLVVFLGEPFLRRAAPQTGAQDNDQRAILTSQKVTLYTAIHDLDFDFHTGKVDQQDYEELRSQLEKEAAIVLRRLDQEDLLAPAALISGGQCPQCLVLLPGGENFCPSCGSPLLSSKDV